MLSSNKSIQNCIININVYQKFTIMHNIMYDLTVTCTSVTSFLQKSCQPLRVCYRIFGMCIPDSIQQFSV